MICLPHQERRAFLGGIALAGPFFVSPGNSWAVILILIFFLPLIIDLVMNGLPEIELRRIPVFAWLILFIGILHVAGLNIGNTVHQNNVLSGLQIAIVLVIGFIMANSANNIRIAMITGFFCILVPIAVGGAAFALVKVALLERGFIFGFLKASFNEYPGGSSLRSDYNLFGMTMIVSGIGLIRFLCERAILGKRLLLPSIGLILVIATGVLAGSRRTLIIGPVILALYWVVLTTIIYRGHRLLRATISVLTGIIVATVALLYAIEKPLDPLTYTVLDRAWLTSKVHNFLPSEGPIVAEKALGDMKIMNTRPGLLLNTVQTEHALGFHPRIDRWEMAINILASQAWYGIGFAYHEMFACKFVKCGAFDYPHMPLMSEWLIAGVVGGGAGIMFYLLIFFAMLRAGRHGWKLGITPALLAVLPFTLISGDTLLSLPQLLTVALLLHSLNLPSPSKTNLKGRNV